MEKVTNMLYYYLGLYLGDGSCRKGHLRSDGTYYMRVTFVCKEPHYKDIENWFKQFSYHQSKGKVEYRCYSTSNKDVIKQLIDNCGDSYNKHLPENMTDDQKWDLLSGFIDSDGCIDRDKIRFYNTNRDLIDQLEECLTSLDIGWTECVQSTKNKTCWAIQINAEDLPRTDFRLKIDYKLERYNLLKNRSKGRKILVGETWFLTNYRELCKRLKEGTMWHRRKEKRYYLYEKEIYKVLDLI